MRFVPTELGACSEANTPSGKRRQRGVALRDAHTFCLVCEPLHDIGEGGEAVGGQQSEVERLLGDEASEIRSGEGGIESGSELLLLLGAAVEERSHVGEG